MPIQLSFADKFHRDNPQAYMRIEKGEWSIGSGGFQITYRIYSDKAACDAGAAPVHSAEVFVAFDSSGMTSVIERAVMQRTEVAAGSPQQVA